MTESWTRFLWLVLGLFAVPGDTQMGSVSLDRAQQPGSTGSDVVDAAASLVEAACVFPGDERFMRRLAVVESSDGGDEKTYRAGYDGGIWQVVSSRR